jgi:hypothetical protein
MFNIDQLRQTTKPAWFGLGFIQLKISPQTRMHFWHPDLKPDVGDEEIHDHRYDFTSEIIYGEITHKVYNFEPAVHGHFERVEVSCDPDNPAPERGRVRGHVNLIGSYTLTKGSSYRFGRDQFHQTSAEKAITLVVREPTRKEFANVVRQVGAPAICAFERKIPEADLWEIIETFLPGVQGDGKIGYHLSDIPKGVVGEASKVFEEVAEFKDALDQDISLMAIHELSDVYGAIESYLANHHPSITVDDLRKMSNVTKRAFVNGHRD